MSESVVVDSSLAVKWLLLEEHSDLADELQSEWQEQGVRLLAPHLLLFEVTNVLHQRVRRGTLSHGAASTLLRRMTDMSITLHHDDSLHHRALDLANQLGQSAAYDSHYLALAEQYDCDLWTADGRYFRSARRITDKIQLLGQPT